jgi:hypothetical protein
MTTDIVCLASAPASASVKASVTLSVSVTVSSSEKLSVSNKTVVVPLIVTVFFEKLSANNKVNKVD